MIDFFDSEASSVDLEFAADYLAAHPKENGTVHDIHTVKLAKSGKGYMLYTQEFLCWLFKKEKTATQLIEALEYYVKVGGGFQLVVQLDKKAKSSVKYGVDRDRSATYFPLGKGFSVYEEESENPSENPFLIPLPLPSLLPVESPNGQPQGTEGVETRSGLQKKGLKTSVASLKVRD